jgi:hypothetical protein
METSKSIYLNIKTLRSILENNESSFISSESVNISDTIKNIELLISYLKNLEQILSRFSFLRDQEICVNSLILELKRKLFILNFYFDTGTYQGNRIIQLLVKSFNEEGNLLRGHVTKIIENSINRINQLLNNTTSGSSIQNRNESIINIIQETIPDIHRLVIWHRKIIDLIIREHGEFLDYKVIEGLANLSDAVRQTEHLVKVAAINDRILKDVILHHLVRSSYPRDRIAKELKIEPIEEKTEDDEDVKDDFFIIHLKARNASLQFVEYAFNIFENLRSKVQKYIDDNKMTINYDFRGATFGDGSAGINLRDQNNKF